MVWRKKPRPSLLKRTPIAEWVAAALGLILTVAVIGYLLAEGLREGQRPPSLSVASEPAQRTGGGYVMPVVVRNSSDTTAASVEVRGTLTQSGAIVEERTVTFAYVPGRGETHGGLVFQNDPTRSTVEVVAEGYEEP